MYKTFGVLILVLMEYALEVCFVCGIKKAWLS